jgi:hypothetical protein
MTLMINNLIQHQTSCFQCRGVEIQPHLLIIRRVRNPRLPPCIFSHLPVPPHYKIPLRASVQARLRDQFVNLARIEPDRAEYRGFGSPDVCGLAALIDVKRHFSTAVCSGLTRFRQGLSRRRARAMNILNNCNHPSPSSGTA